VQGATPYPPLTVVIVSKTPRIMWRNVLIICYQITTSGVGERVPRCRASYSFRTMPPDARLANCEDGFHRARVKGLKPTWGVVQTATMRRDSVDPAAVAIAEKQPSSGHCVLYE